MVILHHPQTLLGLFVCSLVLCFFIGFLNVYPRKFFHYTYFDAADLHDSPQSHLKVDNGTQGFPCILTHAVG